MSILGDLAKRRQANRDKRINEEVYERQMPQRDLDVEEALEERRRIEEERRNQNK